MAEYDLSELNRRIYAKPGVAKVYKWEPILTPGEKGAIARIEEDIRGGKLLDLGVGGGRTTPHLLELSPDYIGVDYSAEMVRLARERTPHADIRQMDARDLSALGSGFFDLVFFTGQGIDSVAPDDRLRILESARAALRPSGWFVFSSHNLDGPRGVRLPWPRIGGGLRPTLGELQKFALNLVHYRRLRRLELQGDGYAMLNDDSHNYTMLTHYISRDTAFAQLRRAGFAGEIVCLAQDGTEVSGPDRTSTWLYYLVRKA